MKTASSKLSARILTTVFAFVAAAGSAGVATAQDSSPYLIGHWKLNDQFSDFKPPGLNISTGNTEFVFLNPTNLTLTLEYAFFGVANGITFCGCDRDTLPACPLYHARGTARWAVLDTTLPHPDRRNDEDNRVSKETQLGADEPTRR